MSDQEPWKDYTTPPATNDQEPWKNYQTQQPPMSTAEIGGLTEPVPQAFLDRLKAGNDQHAMIDRVMTSFTKGAQDAIGPEPYGFQEGSEATDAMEKLGWLAKPGETSPIRLANDAIIRPTAAAADAVLRLLHAGTRAPAAMIAQITAEARGDAEQQPDKVTKDTNEIDMAAQLSLLVAGSSYMGHSFTRSKAGPGGVTDEPVGGLPVPKDMKDAATVLTGGTDVHPSTVTLETLDRSSWDYQVALRQATDEAEKANALRHALGEPQVAEPLDARVVEILNEKAVPNLTHTTSVADKLQKIWEEAGVHPAEAVADAEHDHVLHQQLVSSHNGVPDTYANGIAGRPRGLGPYGRNLDWASWDEAAKNSIVTRELPNGEIIPAPEAIATHLQKFGEEAGFRFQVGPEGEGTGSSSRPQFVWREVDYPDGSKDTQAHVYMPDNTDYQLKNYYGLGRNEILHHEVGHALDYFVLKGEKGTTTSIPAGPLRDEMMAANKQFAPELWARNSQYRSKPSEMMADSIAAWMSNPELRKQMPLFTKTYGAKLQKYLDIADRSLPKKVDGEWQMPPNDGPKFREEYPGPDGKVPVGGGGGAGGPPDGRSPSFEPYVEPPDPASLQAAQDKVFGRLSINESRGTNGYSFKQLYTDLVDKFFPVSESRAGVELNAANDPYKLARLFSGWAGKADHMLNNGTFDFHSYENNGPSLAAILEPVKDDMNGFRAFAAAARAAELDSRGLEHGFDMDAVRKVGMAGIKKYGPVIEKLVAYQNNVSAYLRDSGVLSGKAYDAMVEANKLFVPFHRVMGDDSALGKRLGGVNLQAQNPIKTLVGSQREVIDPIESIVKNTYLLTSMAEKNEVSRALVDMLIDQRAHEAIDGRPPEMSAIPQLPHSDGPPLLEWGEKNGVNLGPDLTNVLHDWMEGDKEGEVSVFRDGTRFTYKVDADLARSMKGLDAQSIGLIERLLKPMASTLRAGAVLDPEFAARHTIRDFLYSFIKTNDGLYSPADTLRGLIGLVTKDQDYWQWQKSGGANATLVSLDRRFMQENLDKLAGQTGLFTRSWNVVIDPHATWLQKGGAVLGLPFAPIGRYVIHPLQMIAEFAMNMNHLGGFKRGLRAAEGARVGETLPAIPGEGVPLTGVGKQALLDAGWASRNTGIDIGRSGAKMTNWNMISAFANAKVQDTTQILEQMAKTPISTGLKITASVTLPSLMSWAINKDDSRYKDLPNWEKFTFVPIITDKWEPAKPDDPRVLEGADGVHADQVRIGPNGLEVNNGHIFRIPQPFSTGVFFGGGAVALAATLYDNNPHAFDGFGKSLLASTVGDLLPNAVTPMLEQSANRTQYTGRTLIPAPLEKQLPEYQYAPYTTELAKKVGATIAAFPGMRDLSLGQEGDYVPGMARGLTSPILIENYVRAWTGQLGVYAMDAMDKAGRMTGVLDDPPHAAATLADIPMVKAFVARYPSANSQSISDFYEAYNRNERFYATYQAQAKEGNADAMDKIAAAGGDEMFSKLDGIKKTIGDHYAMIRSIDAAPETGPDGFSKSDKRQLIDGFYYSMISVAHEGNDLLKAMKAP